MISFSQNQPNDEISDDISADEGQCEIPRSIQMRKIQSLIKRSSTSPDALTSDMSSLITKETSIFKQIYQQNPINEARIVQESFINTIPDEPLELVDLNKYKLTPFTRTRAETKTGCSKKKPNYYILRLKESLQLPESKYNEIQKLYYLHFSQTIGQIQQKHQFKPPNSHIIKPKLIHLPPQQESQKKTLILDLDETLVHCNENLEQKADFYLSITISFGFNIKAGVRIRPYLHQFLSEMSKYYEIVVFTASHRIYAEAVLNKIDPQGTLIHFLFSRESCIQDKGCYIKDLRVIVGRDIKNVVIVDNSTMSFIYQIDNGIPIVPFYNDENDNELISLAEYLKTLAFASDVRIPIAKHFQLDCLENIQDPRQAINLYQY